MLIEKFKSLDLFKKILVFLFLINIFLGDFYSYFFYELNEYSCKLLQISVGITLLAAILFGKLRKY